MEKITIQSSPNQYQSDCGDMTSIKALSNVAPFTIVGAAPSSTLSVATTTTTTILAPQVLTATSQNKLTPLTAAAKLCGAAEARKFAKSFIDTSRKGHSAHRSLADYGGSKSLDATYYKSSGPGLIFRKSHTCGSLYANCNCNRPSTPQILLSSDTSAPNSHNQKFADETLAETTPARTAWDDRGSSESTCDSSKTPIEHGKPQNENRDSVNIANNHSTKRKKKKIFQSYSHPDTSFIFTDENKTPTRENRSESVIKTKSGKLEIVSKRSSTPNIGNYTILDVAIHPEILVKISQKNDLTSKKFNDSDKTLVIDSDVSSKASNSNRNSIESDKSDKSIDIPNDRETTVNDREIVIDSPSSEGDNDSLKKVDSNDSDDISEDQIRIIDKNRLKRLKHLKKGQTTFDSAQKYFLESGILGPISNTSANIIRKTSKILQECNFVEQIRKNSKLLRQQSFDISKQSPTDISDYTSRTILMPHNNHLNHINCNSISDNYNKFDMDRDNKIKDLEDEIAHLKDEIKGRDNEICKLKREIHKLKSVLQQTTTKRHVADGDLLSSLQSHHEMAGQNSPMTVVTCTNSNALFEYETVHLESDNKYLTDWTGTTPHQTAIVGECNHCSSEYIENCQNGNSIPKSNHILIPPHVHAVKKQGVSGESCDSAHHHLQKLPIPKYEKDFSSKQLIKEAIMDNDFLKNIDSTQVRELVESMYSLQVEKGEYVIREGDAGAHLYVSAGGEFEVIKGDKVLGTMGPRKAFGELAILYNCTRTASIRVLSDDARVWVLDRRVFQQIMMRTGMQRIEENVKFLRSVPLLKNLSNDVLTKIADVLEVEFYPAGTYIIRQGASGDTFFLISQGNVKVTQRISKSNEEKEIRTLTRGDYFGEQALINEDKRTANIVALSPGVECLTLDRESFTHLIGDLCELKEKDYGDENRVLSMKTLEECNEFFGENVKQELLDIELSDLETVATLGIGGFGRVELVKCFRNNKMETYALKCLKKQHIVDTRQEEHVFSERTIMLSCNTPFICRLYRTFKDSKYVYMLLESCMGGEVWTILRDRGCFDDNTTQFIIGCVLQAFEYLHTRGIIYRDLKPENLMLSERGYVKLVDFGFAKHIGPSNKTWTFCGTPEYVAPEIILNKGHDRAVDYWALGVLIHELLNGTPPFTANDPMKTYNIILKGIDMVDFPKHMSRSAVTLIKRLCRDVPAERLGYQRGGIQDIKKHKWFQGFDWDGLSNLTLIPPFLRPVSNQLDTSYFDNFPKNKEVPPDEFSGWDIDF